MTGGFFLGPIQIFQRRISERQDEKDSVEYSSPMAYGCYLIRYLVLFCGG